MGMFNWFRRLFGCRHDYVLLDSAEITDAHSGDMMGKWYAFQCPHCGDIKTKKVFI